MHFYFLNQNLYKLLWTFVKSWIFLLMVVANEILVGRYYIIELKFDDSFYLKKI